MVWCTNDPRVHAFAKRRLVTKWGFEYVTTWYWLKVGCLVGVGHGMCQFNTCLS